MSEALAKSWAIQDEPVSGHLATAGDALTEAVAILKQRLGEALGKEPAPELDPGEET